MSRKIALVGHCGPDNAYLRMTLAKALKDAQVVSADDEAELRELMGEGVDLLLLNRELPYGFSETEGVALIEKLHREHPDVKLMLVSNFPDAQSAAVAAGALPGFGKRELGTPRVAQVLKEAVEG